MGRAFAGILGPLALVTVIARGLLHGAAVEATLTTGWLVLIAFAAIGYVIGELAGWTVDDSVRARFTAEMAVIETPDGSTEAT